jgi:hypothetical protein
VLSDVSCVKNLGMYSLISSDCTDPIATLWVLSMRYDLNHNRASLVTPVEYSKRLKSIWWSMVFTFHFKDTGKGC